MYGNVHCMAQIPDEMISKLPESKTARMGPQYL
jgi:hypothetical protein